MQHEDHLLLCPTLRDYRKPVEIVSFIAGDSGGLLAPHTRFVGIASIIKDQGTSGCAMAKFAVSVGTNMSVNTHWSEVKDSIPSSGFGSKTTRCSGGSTAPSAIETEVVGDERSAALTRPAYLREVSIQTIRSWRVGPFSWTDLFLTHSGVLSGKYRSTISTHALP